MHIFRYVGIGVFIVVSTTAHAGSREDWKQCPKVTEPAVAIPACTRIIKRRGEGRKNTGMAYANRCAARYNKLIQEKSRVLTKEDISNSHLRDCDNAIRFYSKNQFAFEIRAYVNEAREEWGNVKVDTTKAIKLGSKDSDIWRLRAESNRRKKQFDSAREDYDRALKLDAKNWRAYRGRAFVLTKLDMIDAAFNDFEAYRKFATPDQLAHEAVGEALGGSFFRGLVKAFMKRGDKHKDKKSFDAAISDYGKAIKVDGNAFAYFDRGRVYQQQNKLTEAIADFDKAIERRKDMMAFWYFRGLAHRKKKNYEQAIADFNEAIKIDPKSDVAFAERGYAYHLNENYKRALDDFNKALALDPKFSMALEVRADNYRKLEKYDLAIEDYNKSIDLDPKSARGWAGRGVAYREKGKLRNAIDDLSHAIKLNPKYSWAFFQRASSYEKNKQFQKAISDYSSYLTLEPNSSFFFLAVQSRGDAYLAAGDFDNAIKDHSRSIEIAPDLFFSYWRRGEAYAKKKEWKAAIADYDKAIQLDETEISYLYHARGKVYHQAGQHKKAIADYNTAIQSKYVYADVFADRGKAYLAIDKFSLAKADFQFALEKDPNHATAKKGLRAVNIAAANKSQPKTQTSTRERSNSTIEKRVELTFWNSVKGNRDPALLKLYLDKYPNGTFAELAKAMIKSIDKKP